MCQTLTAFPGLQGVHYSLLSDAACLKDYAMDTIDIRLSAKTLDGHDAVDPQVTVDIVEITEQDNPVARIVIPDFNGSAVVSVKAPDSFPAWQVTASFSRYDGGAGFLFQPRSNPTPSHLFRVARLPDQWTPKFTPFDSLASPRFDVFKQIVTKSQSVDLKTGPSIGDLRANYDTITELQQVLAKAALLNLYAVLIDTLDPIAEVPWFSYVRRIVRLDQERFIAEVDAGLFENVQTIVNELASTYQARGYFTETPADLALHIPNIPTAYHSDANLVNILTLKKDYEQGNIQLTVSFLRVDGRAVHLLDCDMDENRNIILHSFDLLKHMINGGTNPMSMYDYIAKDSAQQSANGVSNIDLGYVLV
jgi:hypothetical protein